MKQAKTIRIECNPFQITPKTVGEMIRDLAPQIDDIIIAASDALVDQMDLDLDSSCVAFADCYAVGKRIVRQILECPSSWDGETLMILTPAENATGNAERTEDNHPPIKTIARARLKFAPETVFEDDASACRQVLEALISAI